MYQVYSILLINYELKWLKKLKRAQFHFFKKLDKFLRIFKYVLETLCVEDELLVILVPAVESGRFPFSISALSKGPQLAPLASAMEATKVKVTMRKRVFIGVSSEMECVPSRLFTPFYTVLQYGLISSKSWKKVLNR